VVSGARLMPTRQIDMSVNSDIVLETPLAAADRNPAAVRLTHSWIWRRCAFAHRFSDVVGYSPKSQLTMSSRLHCVIDDHLTTLYERHLGPTVELL